MLEDEMSKLRDAAILRVFQDPIPAARLDWLGGMLRGQEPPKIEMPKYLITGNPTRQINRVTDCNVTNQGYMTQLHPPYRFTRSRPRPVSKLVERYG